MAGEKSKESKPPRRRGRKSEGVKTYDKSPRLSRENASNEKISPTSNLEYQPHNSLLIQLDEDAPTWFTYGRQYDERDATILTNPPVEGGPKNTSEIVARYRSLADTIYRREVQLHAQNHGNSSDDRWVESTIKKGTLKDRIAAMSVVVSADPVHKFYALDGLLQMMGCSSSGQKQQTNSRVAQFAAEATEDLFLNTFLPPDRKLLTLAQRPLYLYEMKSGDNEQNQNTEKSKKKKKKKTSNTKKTLSPRILMLWRFEEMVKDKYSLFLSQYLAQTMHESLELQKISAIRSAASLLRSVPEGETQLLQMIANKLGDPAKKVAATAGHELRRVLLQHPAMKLVIAREVQQLSHRPHLSSRALYNCITFLNQLKLSHNDPGDLEGKTSLPASLIGTYFRLFEVAVQKPEDKKKESEGEVGMKSRLLSALLTGVNRAHPYLPAEDKDMDQHIDALYRVVHTSPPAASTQALLLLFHLSVGSDDINPSRSNTGHASTESNEARKDRFYRALYATISHTEMIGAGKHLTMYFNLLYKAMKYETITTRLVVFAKLIISMTLHCSSAVAAASLFLLNEVCKTHPILLTCYQEALSGSDAVRVLDSTKREPKGALVSDHDSKVTEDEKEKRSAGWELSLLSHHFHPSVQKFAMSVGGENNYAGDPLRDFGIGPFLDKFAYRNPKSVDKVTSKYKRGESIAERKSDAYSAMESRFAKPFNDPSFISNKQVDDHDVFFQKFFIERAKRDKLKGIDRGKKPESEEIEEVDVINKEEELDVDGKYEGNFDWETDSEEERFVDDLAMKLIEDASGDFAPDDLDDEDPDMDDWSDDMSDKEDRNSGSDEDQGDSSDDEIQALQKDVDDDDDAFMDGDADESSEGSDESGPQLLEGEDEDVDFAEQSNDDDNDGSEESNEDGERDNQDRLDLAFVDDDFSDDSDQKVKKRKKKKKEITNFASAEDYEEMINKSWKETKRSQIGEGAVGDDKDNMEDKSGPTPSKKATSNKRKRRKR